ncbi:hypothetical protein LEP1GSC061_1265 [Leptospira wolffii serovar Khorat str. Khorat-H2]|nr:hypothetical protein LEP1GSC061_1265 [Leptospira wolffii serovar Khorat str. Khorat-H2]
MKQPESLDSPLPFYHPDTQVSENGNIGQIQNYSVKDKGEKGGLD